MTWEDMDTPEKQKRAEPATGEFLVAHIFNSEEGKKALSFLKEMAYEKTPLTLQNDGMNSVIEMATREGETNFYRKIDKIIKKVEKYYVYKQQ